MNNTAFILTLAYPETIVMVADEWYSPFLRFFGIGKKNYLRAGHAALVLIDKATGVLEYHDFGRYITPEPSGRVRGRDTDHELDFAIKASIKNGEIQNLNEILQFLATHPKLTHGDGKLIASVCDSVDYTLARAHITKMQERHFIRYAAFAKDACNCARFVTDTLIASVTDEVIHKKLQKSKWFTPSTIGNVVLADTKNKVYEVSETGEIADYASTVSKDNRLYFLDRLKNHTPNFVGTLHPKPVANLHEKAQWLSGIAAGAWYELHATENSLEYWYKRISPHGNVDVHALYEVSETGFNYQETFSFIHYSNCKFFHVEQKGTVYRFEIKE
ncbi:hypothetical protein KO494_06940 [Lacinutrix sp. C3R15]|uniref:DUF6695 family protein n=1 Tax=Flavobacteriaceae TaxID=49546 RepID=UPI001C08EB43|nr:MULTISPECIES: DUF6695 family protein [Flavobacteriaceae]MBU2939271.1 hypothetical protein [Lacinutrix sp. C3R15]MDO6622586.1 hypothetical protein [Oceanihabitans sp. 1_MG-2023]